VIFDNAKSKVMMQSNFRDWNESHTDKQKETLSSITSGMFKSELPDSNSHSPSSSPSSQFIPDASSDSENEEDGDSDKQPPLQKKSGH